jgi:putative Holliday junction resolvase
MRVLGIDYGQRRIGLALSDPSGLLARPWKTIARDGTSQQVAAALASEIETLQQEEDGLVAVVMGLPRHLSGDPHEQTRAVEVLVDHMRRIVAVPIVLQDERLTSREAEQVLASRERDWRKRKPLLDAMSAAVILQDYLDALPRRTATEDLDT